MKWIDLQDIGVEGLGWKREDRLGPYDRLPAHAEGKVPQAPWNMRGSTTGMCVTFTTDSSAIWIRREFKGEQLEEYNFNNCAFSGFDLYARDALGAFRWISCTRHDQARLKEYPLATEITERHSYRMYLPLRNALTKAELGIDTGASFRAVAPARKKPVVFYGTSIEHGAYASHAGLLHVSQIGRWLNRPTIDLGFSGAGCNEPEMAKLLGEINAAAYVIATQPNMSYPMVCERTEPFLRILRKARPKTPILLVEDGLRTNAWFFKAAGDDCRRKWAALRKVCAKLRKEGDVNLLYLRGLHLYGGNENSIDGIHPGDLALVSMARKMYPLLHKALGRSVSRAVAKE